MGKNKDNIPFHQDEKAVIGVNQRVNPIDRIVEARLRQDLTLSKGERTKGSSPAYAMGKKQQHKGR